MQCINFILQTLENQGGPAFNVRKIMYLEKRTTLSSIETETHSSHFLTFTKAEDSIEACIDAFFSKEQIPGNRVKAREYVLRPHFPPTIMLELGFRKQCDFEGIITVILEAMNLDPENMSQTEYDFFSLRTYHPGFVLFQELTK